MKPRLFIFGDSWCTPYFEWYQEYLDKNREWKWYIQIENYIKKKKYTPYNFTKYLEKHYEVINFSCGGQSNESIIYQLGKLPYYESGDRILICFTHPVRARFTVPATWKPDNFYRRREVDITPGYLPRYKKSSLRQMMIDRQDSWESGDRNDELEFYYKLKELLNNYNPVFFSWSEDFLNTNINYHDFYGYRIADEYPKYPDYHLGAYGNFLLYTRLFGWLGIDGKIQNFYNGNIYT